MNTVPYPDGEIKVAEWDNFLDEIDQTENIFQLNCENLIIVVVLSVQVYLLLPLVYLQTLIIINWLLKSHMI